MMRPLSSGGGSLPISGYAKPVVYVVSDSIGETAELVTRAAAAQFNAGGVEIRRVPHVDTREGLRAVVEEARGVRSLIVFTIILPELSSYLLEEAARAGIPCVDIMGPMLCELRRLTYLEPKLQPGLVHRMDESYFKRVEAVEFAVKYDDGRDPRGLFLAEMVLIGVSRTSKTPVSLYLAQRGYSVANVPLVPEMPPPEELFAIARSKIIGLTIKHESLVRIRRERLKAMGLNVVAAYADSERVLAELDFARSVFERLRCPVVDVTDRAVEETASRVLEIYKSRRGPDGG